MLSDHEAMVTIAVRDIDTASHFYEGLLGLKRLPGMEGILIYQSGSSTVMVYPSRYAGTNQATAATWNLGPEIERVVLDLAGRGARFEHYRDLPDTRIEGDLHIAGDRKLAWLKDPDGNILALVGE